MEIKQSNQSWNNTCDCVSQLNMCTIIALGTEEIVSGRLINYKLHSFLWKLHSQRSHQFTVCMQVWIWKFSFRGFWWIIRFQHEHCFFPLSASNCSNTRKSLLIFFFFFFTWTHSFAPKSPTSRSSSNLMWQSTAGRDGQRSGLCPCQYGCCVLTRIITFITR